MAVIGQKRRQGIGAALVDAVAEEAAKCFSALALNVHIRNQQHTSIQGPASGSPVRVAAGSAWR